jgi:hypothetical protein
MPIRSRKKPAYVEDTKPYVSTIKNGDGPRVNFQVGPTPDPTQSLLVYQIKAQTSNKTARPTPFKIGFANADTPVLPDETAAGTAGMLDQGELAPGESSFGSPAIGDPGQVLLITCEEPAGADGRLWTSFYCELIEA